MKMAETQEWHKINGFSAILQDGQELWTVKLIRSDGWSIAPPGVQDLKFEEFPDEPLPNIESLHIARSNEEALVTGYTPMHVINKAVIIVANFKRPVRVRQELSTLIFFDEG